MRVTIICDGYLFWYIRVYKSQKDAACMTTDMCLSCIKSLYVMRCFSILLILMEFVQSFPGIVVICRQYACLHSTVVMYITYIQVYNITVK